MFDLMYGLSPLWSCENALKFDLPAEKVRIGCSSENLDFRRTPLENQLHRSNGLMIEII